MSKKVKIIVFVAVVVGDEENIDGTKKKNKNTNLVRVFVCIFVDNENQIYKHTHLYIDHNKIQRPMFNVHAQ